MAGRRLSSRIGCPPSTIRNADVILVMEHGRIVEKGTHHGLLAAKGRDAELYQSRFTGAEVQRLVLPCALRRSGYGTVTA